MRHTMTILLLLFGLTVACWADTEAPKVTVLQMPDGGGPGAITGNLSEGVKIPLRWAESSAVACFPGTRFEQFDGHHVFYRVTLPATSSMTVTLVPRDGAKINLYALRQSATGEQQVPPNVTSAISCEASYPIYANMGGGKTVSNPDSGVRKVEFISVGSPFSILIGVAGAHGLEAGDYTLNIDIKPR